MKRIVLLLVAALLVVSTLALTTALNRPIPVSADSASSGSINVSGSADVKVVPDKVIITLGVETSDAVLMQAKSMNDERVRAVLALREKYGIKAENMQTDYINIQPTYDSYSDRRIVKTYVVQKSIVITLTDISKFEDLLTDALAAGANYVNSVDFRTSDLRKYRDQARELALKAAREKAEAMAATLGRKVGNVTSVSEDSGTWYSSYRYFWGGNYGQSQNVVQNAGGANPGAGSDDSTIAPGQITVNASVHVTFDLQ